METKIDGYPNYAVNELGEVSGPKGKLKHNIGSRGYSQVSLVSWCAGKRTVKSHLVHKLVAAAFIPNPDNKPTVNHKDSNKQNNAASNLEWHTHSENLLHSAAMGTHPTGPSHYRFKDGKQGARRRERRASIRESYKERV